MNALFGMGSIELLLIMVFALGGSAGPNVKPDPSLDTSATKLLASNAPDLPASTIGVATIDGDFIRNAYRKIGQVQPGWDSKALDQALSDLMRARLGVDLSQASSVSVVIGGASNLGDSIALVVNGNVGAPPQAAFQTKEGAHAYYKTSVDGLALVQLKGKRVLLTSASPDNPWRQLSKGAKGLTGARGEQLMQNVLKRVPASPITVTAQASDPFLGELRKEADLPIPEAFALTLGNARVTKLALHDNPERLNKLASSVKDLRTFLTNKLQEEMREIDRADFFEGLTLVAASQLIDPVFDTLVIRQDGDILVADVPDIALAFAGAGGAFAAMMIPMMLDMGGLTPANAPMPKEAAAAATPR